MVIISLLSILLRAFYAIPVLVSCLNRFLGCLLPALFWTAVLIVVVVDFTEFLGVPDQHMPLEALKWVYSYSLRAHPPSAIIQRSAQHNNLK